MVTWGLNSWNLLLTPFGLLTFDISFGGGKLCHALIITKSWERNYTTVILINLMVVAHKLDFASQTPAGLVKRVSGPTRKFLI